MSDIKSIPSFDGFKVFIPITNKINKKTGVLKVDYNDYIKYDLKSENLRIKNTYAFHRLENKFVHRLVLNENCEIVDHVNKIRLDCTFKNLRKSSYQLNKANSKPHKNRKYKGVRKSWSKYRSTIVLNGKQIHLGMYKNEKDAAIAYNEAAAKYFGKHAELNNV